MKKFLCLAVVFASSLANIYSENFLNDPDVLKGKLENGLTYYIKENHKPSEKASLRLVVKAGSLHEKEHERGLAHFVEHMVFRGSENFADWEVIDYFESIGASFGADTNAQTNFDTTTYMLEIPTNEEGVLDKSLMILSDWAGRMKVEQKLLDKERGVILDELRVRTKNVSWRNAIATLNKLFPNSFYLKRLPIGLESVIKKCTDKDILGFYRRWYKPNRMALVAVGDFDAKEVQEYISKHFSSIKSTKEIPTEPSDDLGLPKDFYSMVIRDKENTVTTLSITNFYRIEHAEEVDSNSIKTDLYNRLFDLVMGYRLDELSRQYPSPFTYVRLTSSPFGSKYEQSGVTSICYEDRPLDALRALIREFRSILNFGITESELSRAKTELIEGLRQGLLRLDQQESRNFVGIYIDNFLHNVAYPQNKEVLEGSLLKIEELTNEEFVKIFREGIELFPWHIVVTGPESLSLSSEQIEEEVDTLLAEEIQTKAEKTLKATLLSKEPKEGKIAETHSDDVIGSTTLLLDNNMKVILKQTDLKKEQVLIRGFAKGGINLFSEDEIASANMAVHLLRESGLSHLSAHELDQFLGAHDLGFSFTSWLNQRLVTSRASKKELENALALVHALFSQKNFDEKVFKRVVEEENEVYKNRSNNPMSSFMEHVNDGMYDSHYLTKETSPYLATFSETKQAAIELFSDPSEFTFVIVGDFDLEALMPLIKKYLASITAPKLSKRVETFPKLTHISKNSIHAKGAESPAITLVIYPGDFSSKKDSFWTLKAMTNILEKRLLENLRKKLGETYSVSVSPSLPSYPDLSRCAITISTTGTKDSIEVSREVIKDEIDRIVNEMPSEEELSRVKAVLAQERKTEWGYNTMWLNFFQSTESLNISPHRSYDYKTRIAEISPKKVHEMAHFFFSEKEPLQFVHTDAKSQV